MIRRTNTELSAEHERLIGLIPGYDPWRDSDGCWFDAAAAQAALDFFPECLRHVEGDTAGEPFVLQDWQKAIVVNLFGWKTTDAKGRTVRRYRTLFLFVPRGNGKTPLLAGLLLLLLFFDGEPAAKCYCLASDSEQATIMFRHASGMVSQSPILQERSQVFAGKVRPRISDWPVWSKRPVT